MTKKINTTQFFKQLDHPFLVEINEFRKLVRSINSDIKEEVRMGVLHYIYKGYYFATCNLWRKECLEIVFHKKVENDKTNQEVLHFNTSKKFYDYSEELINKIKKIILA
jgi:hypothetical protein